VCLLLTHGDAHRTALQVAARKGSAELVELLLRHKADPDFLGEYFSLFIRYGTIMPSLGGKYGTALQEASSRGDMDTVKLLLVHNANPNIRGEDLAAFD
jgi:ankyrin repeat protein